MNQARIPIPSGFPGGLHTLFFSPTDSTAKIVLAVAEVRHPRGPRPDPARGRAQDLVFDGRDVETAPFPCWRTSDRNSRRVSFWRKHPTMAEVTVEECCFSMPRIIMQRWRASTTTPTPCGSIAC